MDETIENKDDSQEKTPKPKVYHNYPLLMECDMNEDMKIEAMELCVSACDKYFNDNEGAAKMIKEVMDKKFGATWHVVVGEGFGFEITHENQNLLYMFNGGNLAVCTWKCS